MNPLTIRFLVAAAATAAAAGSARAAPLIHEPFADSNSSLTGNTPGTGLAGTWTATALFTVPAGSLSYGSLSTSGNRAFESTTGNAGASVGTLASGVGSLRDAGLLADGATLWFSMVINTPGSGGSNPDSGFGFGTDAVPQTGMQTAIGTGKYAIGWTIKNDKLQASIWNGTANVRGTNGPAVSTDVTKLVVGKIVWGADDAASDAVSLYLPDDDLNLGASVASTSATIAESDQLLFDTISFGLKTNSAFAFDEIRVGGTSADVLPVPEPSSLALLGLAGMALRRRRCRTPRH